MSDPAAATPETPETPETFETFETFETPEKPETFETPGLTRVWRPADSERPVALGSLLGVFGRGSGDPTYRRGPAGAVVLGIRPPTGPACLELTPRPTEGVVLARSWGAGAEWALSSVPDLLGDGDDAGGFVAHHAPVAQAARRHPGWRVPRSRRVVEALVPAVIEQKVTGQEAFGGYRRLVWRYGEIAPGPYGARGLRVPPSAATWAMVPSWEFLRSSVDHARSRTLVGAVRVAGRLEECAELAPESARARMRALPGVGAWTAAEVAQRALGDADSVSFGDYHVAKDITWSLIGEARGDDVLAEVLAPYAGHRYRVQRLLELDGHHRPRRGPRMALRSHLPR